MSDNDSALSRAIRAQQERESKREADAQDRAHRISAALKDRQDRRDFAQRDREQRRNKEKPLIFAQAPFTGPRKKEFQRTLETFVPLFRNRTDLDIVVKEWQITLESMEATGATEQTEWSTGAYTPGPPASWTEDGAHTHTFSLVIDIAGDHFHTAGEGYSSYAGSHTHTGSVSPGSPDGEHKHVVIIPALSYTYNLYNLNYNESRTTYICIRGGSLIGFFDSEDPDKPPTLPDAKTLTFNIVVP